MLFYCAFAGIFKAIYLGYFNTLVQLGNYMRNIDGESVDMGIKAFIETIIKTIVDSVLKQVETQDAPLTTIEIKFEAYQH